MVEMGDDTSSDVFESTTTDKDNDIYIYIYITARWDGGGRGSGREGAVFAVFLLLLCFAVLALMCIYVLCFVLRCPCVIPFRFELSISVR